MQMPGIVSVSSRWSAAAFGQGHSIQRRAGISGRARSAPAVLLAAMLLGSPPPATADVVRDWNLTMFTTLAGQNPFSTARYAAITHLAVFEAVNAITREYRPYIAT